MKLLLLIPIYLLFKSHDAVGMPLTSKLVGADSFTGVNYYKLNIHTSEHQISDVLQTYLTANDQLDSHLVSFEKGLSPFVNYANNHIAMEPFANCFNSAFASIVTSFWPERFMSSQEFKCLLKSNAKQVSDWQFGDIAVIFSNKNPIHAMTYLGWDKNSSNTHFVFSKLGYDIPTKYLVTTLSDMLKLYGSDQLKFYRIENLYVTNPADSDSPECRKEYVEFSKDFGKGAEFE